ncbi:putative cell surface spherulin 4-like protein [Mariannaea sp. PMI_226]|nr:putative cell surface spherulin 4-like protein [Mariannaea sp. PMI_226]
MRAVLVSTALANLVTSVAATGILLPLYVYPSANANDGAANWHPVFDAVTNHPDIDWTIVVNPDNGPGATGKPGNDDANYISGVSQLNSFKNVKTVGYVRTNYGQTPMDQVQNDIFNYANWTAFPEADISIHGIFFDESPADFSYLEEAIQHARQINSALNQPIVTICNFGVAATPDFYNICDIVVGFESCLNCDKGPQYKGQETLSANFPSDKKSQGAVIVNTFAGQDYQGNAASAELLTSYLMAIVDYGLGWFYFCSAGYNDITSTPATVGQNADSLASAR